MKMLLCLCSCRRPGGPSDIIQLWPPKCSHHALLRDTRSRTRRPGMGPWVWLDCTANRCKSQIQQRHERDDAEDESRQMCSRSHHGGETQPQDCSSANLFTCRACILNNLLQKQQSRSVKPHTPMSKALGGTRNICILI